MITTVESASLPSLPTRWRVALRPGALPKVLLPLSLGLGLALVRGGFPGGGALLLAVVLGLMIQAVVLLVNDLGDRDADRLHLAQDPAGLGPRVLPLGWLQPRDLARVALVVALLSVLPGLGRWLAGGSGELLVLCLWALALPVCYSLPPLRLNYRGGGELLESLGTGVLLPLLGWACCGMPLALFPPAWLVPPLALAAAGALASGLSHAPSDRQAGKRTVAVLAGTGTAARLALYLALAALPALAVLRVLEAEHADGWLALEAAIPAIGLGLWLRARRRLPAASNGKGGEDPARAIRQFKRALKALLLWLWLGMPLAFCLRFAGEVARGLASLAT